MSVASCGNVGFTLDPIFFRHGTDDQIGEETDDQQSCHDVQNDWIGLLFGNVPGHVMIEDTVHNQRAYDAGGRPGSEQSSVNGADMIATEEVFEVGGDRGEATAVHANQHP